MENLFDSTHYTSIRKRLENLSSGTTPLWGKMTVNQMICHVSDPLRDLLGDRQTRMAVPAPLRPLVKRLLLTKRPYMKNSRTLKTYSQRPGGLGTPPTTFEADRQALFGLLDRFHAAGTDYSFGAHAAVGKLRGNENGMLMWKHLDHHLRQFGV